MKILVIEDNPDIKEVLDYILVDEGYEVMAFSDASSLEVLDQLKPDLILIDEILADVRGSDLIKKLKVCPISGQIPVILISAMPGLKEIAEECGATAYIEKPFDIDTITEVIKNILLPKQG